ncbi:hypothetical protein XH98_00505 [Bradyrhizobium sp. CCBAU 51745]|nr:hypothetical protein [Bradyrhizobium sp. CCBAU 51745]
MLKVWNVSWRRGILIERPQRIGKRAWIHETSFRILDLIVNVRVSRLSILAEESCIPHGPDELTCDHWIADLHMSGIGVQDLMKETILVSDRDRSPLILASVLNHAIHRRSYRRIALVQTSLSSTDIVKVDTSMRI